MTDTRPTAESLHAAKLAQYRAEDAAEAKPSAAVCV